MCQSEPCGAIAVPMEVHSKQRGQLPRMHESGVQGDIAKISDVGGSKA